MNEKLLLVACSLSEDHERYPRFRKLLKRTGDVQQVDQGIWFLRTDRRPNVVAASLGGLLDGEEDGGGSGQRLIVTTIKQPTDTEHLNGWAKSETWQFAGLGARNAK